MLFRSYPNTLTRKCELCHYTCVTCLGPSKNQCTSCDETQGYMKLERDYGVCQLITCGENQFFNPNLLKCVNCDSSCGLCDKQGNCTECKKGLIASLSPELNKTVCSGCPKGYKMGKDGICKGNSF